MRDLPNWIRKVLSEESLTCGACGKVISLKELFSVGIQKSSKKPHKDVLSICIVCNTCKEMTNFELGEMTLLDFAFEILDEQSKVQTDQNKKDLDKEMGIAPKKKIKSKSKPVKSKITMKEIRKSVSFLEKLETHDDFLMALGMSIEEIDSYKINNRQRKDNESK